jgi:ferric iron reductase protein FhuF
MTDFMATKDTVNTKVQELLSLSLFAKTYISTTAFYPLMQARVTSHRFFRMDKKTKYKRKRSSVERIFKIDFYIINT